MKKVVELNGSLASYDPPEWVIMVGNKEFRIGRDFEIPKKGISISDYLEAADRFVKENGSVFVEDEDKCQAN